MDKLNKLQDLLKLLNEGLTREEFIKNFGLIIDLVKKLQTKNDTVLGSIDAKYNSIVSDIRRNYDKDMEGAKHEALEYCMEMMKGMMDKHEARMVDMEYKTAMMDEELKPKVVEMCKEEVLDIVLPLIPAVENIELDLPKLGKPIRDGLELLPEGEKLKIDAIENLRKELDDLRKVIQLKTAPVMGGGGVGKHNVTVYDLSPYLDGVTKTFTLPSFWKVNTVDSSSFPHTFRKDIDYTTDASASTITFTSEITAATTLAAGQSITIEYAE